MKDDLISRQAAIDALAKFVPYAICDESTESYANGLNDAYNLIVQLPSALKETCEGCKHLNKCENEVECGYNSPCTTCKRRVEDHYER